MAFRLNYRVTINWVPDGFAGTAPAGGGNMLGIGNVLFTTVPQGIAIPYSGVPGASPTAADLLTAFNAMRDALVVQVAPLPILNRIQQFSAGGS